MSRLSVNEIKKLLENGKTKNLLMISYPYNFNLND